MRNISTRMDAVLKRNLWCHAKMAVGALIRRDSISKDSCNITMCEGGEGGGGRRHCGNEEQFKRHGI